MSVGGGWRDGLDGAIAAAADADDAASRLGVRPQAITRAVGTRRPDLAPRWAELCARSRREPRASSALRARAGALVAEAAGDSPPLPGLTQRENVVRILAAMVAASGSARWPRGWVGALMRAVSDAGCPPPTPEAARWYRQRLVDEPLSFMDVPGVDPDVVADLDAA